MFPSIVMVMFTGCARTGQCNSVVFTNIDESKNVVDAIARLALLFQFGLGNHFGCTFRKQGVFWYCL